MANSRKTAFKVLLKIEQDGAYSNIALNNAVKEGELTPLDAAFTSALVYGVLERKITLDYIIKQYSKIPLRKIELKTKIILRLGLLQMAFMDKIPESAAVNESVKLAKQQKLQKSSGFINAILRSFARDNCKVKYPDIKNKAEYYSVKYSCPQPLVKLWLESYGEENAKGILEKLSGRPNIYARVNTLRTTAEKLIDALADDKVKAEKVDFPENSVRLADTGSIERLKAYKGGLFHIQDLSSQLCAYFLSAEMGQTVLDICSAPGGKTFTTAEYMHNSGKIIACDMYEHKLKLIEKGAKRLGINIVETCLRDGSSDENPLPMADRILCDVPCSGLGVLSRKPEIRYKDDLIDTNLADIQYKILCESAKYLKKGGKLVYSTCTLNPQENNKNTAKFLAKHSDFKGVALELPPQLGRAYEEQPYEITLMPHSYDGDGFYISIFTRR
jgi:16S rRNA (cytosine967-C5)-methyltransferase